MGRTALKYLDILIKKCKRDISDAEKYLKSDEIQSLEKKIQTTLKIKLKKEIKFIEKKKMQNADKQKHSNVEVTLNNGLHPNILRFQKPSNNWCIYIDETGKEFDENARTLKDDDL